MPAAKAISVSRQKGSCSCLGTDAVFQCMPPLTCISINCTSISCPLLWLNLRFPILDSRALAERDGTRAETRFHLSPKWMSPFKLVGASVQSTAGSRGVCISLGNAGYTTFGGGVRVLATHSIRQFPLHFPSHVPSGSERALLRD